MKENCTIKRQVVIVPAQMLEDNSNYLVCYIDDETNGSFSNFVGVGDVDDVINYIVPSLRVAVEEIAKGNKPRVKITLEYNQ